MAVPGSQLTCSHHLFVRTAQIHLMLQVPEALDFGLTSVKGQIKQVLRVQNTGEAVLSCSWEITQPFSISPVSASIEAFVFVVCHKA